MEKRKYTPSEFYKIRRPEYFSDSDINYEFELPKEVLALELKNITKNQKENEFELLCRQFSEKLITPNLIPQVGPTGGGDGFSSGTATSLDLRNPSGDASNLSLNILRLCTNIHPQKRRVSVID